MFLIIEVSSDKRAAYVLWAVDRTLPGRIAGAPVVAEECERAGRSWNWALVTLRIDSPASPAVPAQFTRMSMRPNSFMHVSISASATDGSDGEPAYPTPEIRCAAASTASEPRPMTTTPAPSAASSSATANPMPRDPPTTTAALPASGSLIGFALLHDGLHHVHVPEAAHVGQQAGVVDLVGEYAADSAC